MLEFLWIPRVDGRSSTIYVQFSDETAAPVHAHQFFTERPVFRAFPESQKPNENIRLWVFVRQKCLPAAVGRIVPSEQFDRLWAYTVMDLV